jgi:hypothetical protein
MFVCCVLLAAVLSVKAAEINHVIMIGLDGFGSENAWYVLSFSFFLFFFFIFI